MSTAPSAAPGAAARGSSASSALGPLVRQALAWSLLNNVVARVGGLLTSVVLARVLVPAEYGTFAVAFVVLAGLLSCNELGVSLAVVRWPGDPRRIASTVNAISIAASVVATAGGMAAAGPIAHLLGAPAAEGVIRLLCLAAFVDGATAVPAALLTREFRQRETTFIDLSGMVLSSTVSVVLAVRGHGAYSLAWGQLAGNLLIAAALLRRSRPYVGLRVDLQVVRPLLTFGLPLAGSSLLVFLMLNADYLVIGSMLGSTQLGLYFLAFNLASAPVTLLSVAVRRVAMPAFVRTRDEGGDVGGAFASAVNVLMVIVVPGCLFLAVHAASVVRTVYGDTWSAASSALAFLACFAIARILTELSYDLLVTLARARLVLVVQACWFMALAVALPVGAREAGITGVAIGHVSVAFAIVLPAFLIALGRSGLPVRPLSRAVREPLLAGLLVVGTGVCIEFFAGTGWLSLLLAAPVAAASTLLVALPVLRRAGVALFTTKTDAGESSAGAGTPA